MTHRSVIVALALGLLTAFAFSQSAPQQGGSIEGVVFTTEQDHARSVVPGTKVLLDGASHLEAETDDQGKFAFGAVPAGPYTISAQAPGMVATQNVEVRATSVSQLELELKVQTVTESATVTAATEEVATKESSGSATIS